MNGGITNQCPGRETPGVTYMSRLQQLKLCMPSRPDVPLASTLVNKLQGGRETAVRAESLDNEIHDVANNTLKRR